MIELIIISSVCGVFITIRMVIKCCKKNRIETYYESMEEPEDPDEPEEEYEEMEYMADIGEVTSIAEIDSEKECPICFEPLCDNPVRILPCFHMYHIECIDDWYERKQECPECGTRVI